MSEFNCTKFEKQGFQPRIKEVEVDSLYKWFNLSDEEVKWLENWFTLSPKEQVAIRNKKEKKVSCIWKVRGLTGNELAKTIDSTTKVKNLEAIIEAMGNSQEKIEELKGVMGMGNDTEPEILRKLEQLVLGSVEPKIESHIAVKLAETFPIEFYMLTQDITLLTGMGMDLKK